MHSILSALKPVIYLVATGVIWRIAGLYLRSRFLRKLTVMELLHDLGTHRGEDRRLKGSAVICGGSIAGLWAARVCADHFEDVVIVESENWLATDEGTRAICDENGDMYVWQSHERKRVMQADVVHVYQTINIIALRKLFPECDAELKRRGAQMNEEIFNVYTPGGRISKPILDRTFGEDLHATFSVSRETYEKTLRYFVRRIPNIRWVKGTITDMQTSEDSNVVKGVTVRSDKDDAGDCAKCDTFLPATLVIDCSGRAQAGLKWIKRIHAALCTSSPNTQPIPPPYLKYDIQCRYQTFCFNIAPELRRRLNGIIPGGYDNAGWLLTYIPEPGLESRMAVITKIEGNRIKFVAMSYGDSELPRTSDDLETMLHSLKCKEAFPSWIYDTIEVLIENRSYTSNNKKIPPCSWIQYEKSTHIPHNFIATGDAVMCANPLWGEGCSKAIVGAVTLDAALRTALDLGGTDPEGHPGLPKDFSKDFFEAHSEKIRRVWEGTKPVDYGYCSTIPVAGETLQTGRLARTYVLYVLKLSLKNATIANWMWHVRLFLAPSTDLLHPYVLGKVAWEVLREFFGGSRRS